MIESTRLISLLFIDGLIAAPFYFVKRSAYVSYCHSKEGNLLLDFLSCPEFANKSEKFSPLYEAERGRGVSRPNSMANLLIMQVPTIFVGEGLCGYEGLSTFQLKNI